MAKGTFYVGRVIKTGVDYDQNKLIEAILRAPAIKTKKYKWGFVETGKSKIARQTFIYGQLAQYESDGQIDVIEESTRSRKKSQAKNQVRSTSKFVYFPEHSGIVFLNVWNSIPVNVFIARFSELIDSFFGNMFVNTEIELITDYKKFSTKIKELDAVTEISANVHLPNPLFGDLWGELDKELRSRNSECLEVTEKAKAGGSMKTNLVELVSSIVEFRKVKKIDISISEAAVLMAADGYGKGTVHGVKDLQPVIVKTDKMELTISMDKDLESDEIAAVALDMLNKVKLERNMKHGK
jgi:hypothetical protein